MAVTSLRIRLGGVLAFSVVLAACSVVDEAVESGLGSGGEGTGPTYVRETRLPEEIIAEQVESNQVDMSILSACLEDAGFSIADTFVTPGTRELTAREAARQGFTPPPAGASWSYTEVVDQDLYDAYTAIEKGCIAAAGGSVNDPPELIAAYNESLLIEIQCMRDLGWSDYPDPIPGDNGQLFGGSYEWPSDAEALEQFLTSKEYCGEQSGIPFFRR